jgi:dephospho-CoA kinase
MMIIGLTGSIASGKSEVAKIFREHKIPVFDADAAVHQLYQSGEAVAILQSDFPEACLGQHIDRQVLARLVSENPERLHMLESLVHPLVRAKRDEFLNHARKADAPLAVLEIPLLFETGQHRDVDFAIVVSASPAVQQGRALARPQMTKAKFQTILQRQMPDVEKRKLAHGVILNDGTLEELRAQTIALLTRLIKMAEHHHA